MRRSHGLWSSLVQDLDGHNLSLTKGDSMDIEVVDNFDQSRYEARGPAGELLGQAGYQLAPRLVVFTHTEVESAYEGQGVGSALAQHALDDVRSRGLKVVAVCPYIKAWIDRHPEYAALLYRARPSSVTD